MRSESNLHSDYVLLIDIDLRLTPFTREYIIDDG